MEAIAKALVKVLKPQPRKVLDIGCAKGFLVKAFQDMGIDAIGVDISSYAIKHGICSNLILADATNLCFKSNTFDLVVSIHTIEHLRNPEKLIAEARRVLKPGGYLFIVTPTPEGDKKRKIPDPTHVSVYSEKKWMTFFNGFERLKDKEREIARIYTINLAKAHAKMYANKAPTSFIGKILNIIKIRQFVITLYLFFYISFIDLKRQYFFLFRKTDKDKN